MTSTSTQPGGEDAVALVWRPGDVILDLYEVLEVVRSGGMGLVYRVRHRGWDIELAVKAPRPELAATPAQLRDFEAEAEVWAGLGSHPHTVSCAYVRRIGGVPRVFAEWVDGGSLADWVRDRRLYEGGPRAALERMLDVAIQFSWGLEHAHARDLVHQDVKPANVMLTRDGVAKVTDFGLARARAAAGESVLPGAGAGVSYSGMTRAYCSPEQALAARPSGGRLTRATDVWSWALSVLELFVGGPPCLFGPAGGEALTAYDDGGQADPQIPVMPKGLVSLLRQCFEGDPAQRPATMRHVADALVEVHAATFDTPYPRVRPEAAGLLADGLSNQALSMLDLGRSEQAHALWEQALQADGHHVHTIYNRGLARWRRAETTDQQLLVALETIHADDAEQWTAAYLLGRVHLERNDYESALDLLGEAGRLAPADAEVNDAIEVARRQAASGRSTTLLAHAERVTAATLTADGRVALTGCADGSLRLWDAQSGRLMSALPPHDSKVSSVALSADGRRCLSGDDSGVVRVCDVQSSSCLHTFALESRALVALSADGSVAVAASLSAPLQVWELPSGECLHTIDDRGKTWSLAVSADGLRAVTGRERSMQVWEPATAQPVRRLESAATSVMAVAVSADGRQALAGESDGTLKLWDLRSGDCLQTLEGPGRLEPITSVALSGDGRLALTQRRNDTGARLWELGSGRCLRSFGDGPVAGSASALALSADGRVALSSGRSNRNVTVWALRPGSRSPWSYTRPSVAVESAHAAGVVRELLAHAARMIDEGRPAAAIAELRGARSMPGYERNRELLDCWQRAGRQGRRTSLRDGWQLHDLAARDTTQGLALALSADGRLAARGLQIHDLRTGRVLHKLAGQGDPIRSLAASPEGRLAAAGGETADGAVRVQVWELETGRCLRVLEFPGDRFTTAVRVTPDGRLALTDRGQEGNVLWNTETGSMLHELAHDGFSLFGAALSADGRLALSADGRGAIRVWDLRSGICVSTLRAPEGCAESLALSADGRFAVSGGRDCAIRMWELETERCLRTLTGHPQPIASLALSADSHVLLSGSTDGTVRAWELDWEYDFPAPAEWEEQARPHLELFIRTHAMLHPGAPLTREDHERLVAMLQRAGCGWLRRGAVVDELERMWADARVAGDQASGDLERPKGPAAASPSLGAGALDAALPDLARKLYDESNRLSGQGRRTEALAAVEEALDMVRSRPDGVPRELAISLCAHVVVVSGLDGQKAALAAVDEVVAAYARPGMPPGTLLPDVASSLYARCVECDELGRRDEALVAIAAAVAIRWRLIDTQGGSVLVDLAIALNHQSVVLSGLGRHDEALAASVALAAVRRHLEGARLEAFMPHLAGSRHNESVALSALGRHAEALAAIEEAIAIRRRLQARPETFLPDLAESLEHQDLVLSALGRHQEAIAASEEADALAVARPRAAARRDATRELVGKLYGTSTELSEQGRREEALAAIEKAISMVRAQPGAFRQELAISLNTQFVVARGVGPHQEALAAVAEAAPAYRRLAGARPDDFLPDLASSLRDRSIELSEVGRHQEALAAILAAIAAFCDLVEAQPDPFRLELATSFDQGSVVLGAMGDHERALGFIEQSVVFYRLLTEAHLEAVRPDLAKSLHNQCSMLRKLGRLEEAMAAINAAIAIRRGLVEAQPEAFLRDLAQALEDQSSLLNDLGRHQEGRAASEEAAAIRGR